MSLSESPVLSTSAGPEALHEIEAALEKVWSDNDHVPVITRMQVGIAVGEIAANIIRYAASGLQVQIHMHVAILPKQVKVEFVDNGHPAEIDLSAVEMPDDFAESGRGLALAQAALESLSYQRNAHNHWILVSKPFA